MSDKFEIANKKEFASIVDEIGDLQVEITQLEKKIKARVEAASKWAIEHPSEAFERGSSGSTKKYDYKLTAAARAVRRAEGQTQESVVALLAKDKTMAKYVYSSYDTKQIGADFGGNAEKRKSICKFGLYFTEPKGSKLEVLS